MAEADAPAGTPREERSSDYKFGFGTIKCVKPSEGVPDESEWDNPPKADLQLYFSHGYNGNSEDSRQNLYLTNDKKELLYFTAAVVVKHNIADNTQQFFTLHNDDVTTLAKDPAEGSTLVASGQKDPKDRPGQGKDEPKIYVWDYATMKNVRLLDHVCWGKVARVQISKSGNLYSVGGDPDQTLKVWSMDQIKNKDDELTPRINQPTTKEPMLGFEINPYGKFEAPLIDEIVLYSKRKFAYAKVEGEECGGNEKLKFSFKNVTITKLKKDGEKAFTAACWLNNGKYVVGAASGSFYICEGATPLRCLKTPHAKAVGSLCFTGEMVVSTGFDKKLKKWELAEDFNDNKKPLVKKFDKEVAMADKSHDFVMQPRAVAYDAENDIAYCGVRCNQIAKYECKTDETSIVIDGHDGQIWGLATHPTENFYATGGYDNAVKVWNADTLKCVNTYEFDLKDVKVRQEINSAAWSPDGKYIAFGSESSWVFIFTYPEFKQAFAYQIPLKNKKSELEGLSYLRFSADSLTLGATHMDSNAYIFGINPKYDGTNALAKIWPKPLKHTGAPINCQWSEDGEWFKTFNRNYEVTHFRINKKKKAAKFEPTVPDPDKVKWTDDPLIAGWDTQGLYQGGWDGTDLNDATVTSDGAYICSGDDYGCVRLHNYPAISNKEGANKRYYGHAEFVVGVEFLRDDSQLITCGGNDQTIFQWKLNRPE